MNELYETKISDARWMAYDIPGNVGWITWLVCAGLCFRRGFVTFGIVSLLPAALMLVGVIELISERVAKLDRVLTRARLWRGFGALTLGGLIGIPVAIIGLVVNAAGSLPLWMLAGAALCFGFAGLLLKGYHRQ